MRFYQVVSVLIFVLVSCSDSDEKNEVNPSDDSSSQEIKIKEPFYEVVTEEINPNEYGYQILKDGKMIINQMNIPAVQGNKGFPSKKKALETGELMLFKIKNGVFPPTISKEELDSLGVIQLP